MPISGQTKKALRRLAYLAVHDNGPLDRRVIADSGFRQGLIPANLREEGDAEELGLSMYGDEYRSFNQALRLLADERELEHLQQKEIDSSLWELVCDLSVHQSAFRDGGKRAAKLESYLQTVAKPPVSFQVAVLIDNLRVDAPISIGPVRLERWKTEEPEAWRIRRDDLAQDFVDRTVAIVSVSASRPDIAFQRAEVLVDRCLELLRVGYAAPSPVRITDSELMFRRGEKAMIREEHGARSQKWDLRFRPFEASLSVNLINRTTQYLEPVQRVLSNDDLQPAFRKRFSLVFRWMATAIIATDYDEKVVDTCTALESLLTSRSDGRKGELIALRAMLLQLALEGQFTPTFALLPLYELRSRIVHGSDIGLCGEAQYTYLLDTTMRLAAQAVVLVNANPGVRNFRNFRNILESEKMLRAAVSWFERYGKYGETIVRTAKGLLPNA